MDIHSRLETALKFAKSTCFIGSGNKIKDVERTSTWSYGGMFRKSNGQFIKQSNSDSRSTHKKWIYQKNESSRSYTSYLNIKSAPNNPLHDPQFNLSEALEWQLRNALAAQKTRVGNCGDLSGLIVKYLWENNQGINKIEFVIMKNYDHAFIIVNRPDNSDLNDASTWGNDTWCIDAWYEDGIIFSAAEFNKQIAKTVVFAERQSAQLKTKGINWDPHSSKDTDFTLKIICTILPQQDRYPTYSTSPFYPLEYYYDMDVFVENKDTFNRNKQYAACLAEYKNRQKTNIHFTQEMVAKYKQTLESIPQTSLDITEKKLCDFLIKNLTILSYGNKNKFKEGVITESLIKAMIELFHTEYKKLSSYFFFWFAPDAITTLNQEKDAYTFTCCIGLILKDILRVNDKAALQSTIKTSFNLACLEKLQPHKMFPMLAETNVAPDSKLKIKVC